jgi:outer membrane protein TolC
VLQSELSGEGVQTSTTSGLQSTGGQFVSRDYQWTSSVVQALPIGGNVQLSFSSLRTESNSPFDLLPTSYNSALRATVNFPLLQNRGNRTLKTPIEQAEHRVELAELTLRDEVIGAVGQTQDDYLDLILARENLKVQQQSLELAQNLLEVAQAQERVGTLAPIEVLSAEAAVAAREEGVILAESAVLAAEDVLRASLNLPESLAMWRVGIVPTDVPGDVEPQPYELEQAVARALEMRPDYQQAKVGLRTQRLEVELQRDEARPQLDVVGSFGFVGNSQLGLGLGGDGEPVQVPQGGIFGSHFEDLLSLENFTWNLGLVVRQPLGNRAALSAYRVQKLELERQLLELRTLELGIVTEVRALLRSIETNRKRVAATRVAAELARRRLEAEQKKFEVGTSTSFDVLQFQEEYVRAATSQTQAIIDLNRSVLALQQALGLTLEANGIRIDNGRPSSAAAAAAPPGLTTP